MWTEGRCNCRGRTRRHWNGEVKLWRSFPDQSRRIGLDTFRERERKEFTEFGIYFYFKKIALKLNFFMFYFCPGSNFRFITRKKQSSKLPKRKLLPRRLKERVVLRRFSAKSEEGFVLSDPVTRGNKKSCMLSFLLNSRFILVLRCRSWLVVGNKGRDDVVRLKYGTYLCNLVWSRVNK